MYFRDNADCMHILTRTLFEIPTVDSKHLLQMIFQRYHHRVLPPSGSETPRCRPCRVRADGDGYGIEQNVKSSERRISPFGGYSA